MIDFATYNGSTGEVLSTGNISEDAIGLQAGPIYVGTVNPDTQYINVGNGSLSSRPASPTWSATTLVADGASSVSIGPGLPSSTLVDVETPLNLGLAPVFGYNETSGTFTFSTTVAGQYTVRVKPFPYQNVVATITAT